MQINIINKQLLVILGFSIFALTFYRRFIILRLPKSLYFLENFTIKYIFIVVVLMSIITSCLIIRTYIYILFNKPLPDNIFIKIGMKIHEMIENAISEAFGVIINAIPNSVDKISNFCQKFYNLFETRPETFFLFILYFIRIIILMSFLIDVFIHFRFNYMHKAFYLLTFSVLIKVLFYVLRNYASNTEQIESVLIIIDKGLDSSTNLPITTYEFNDEHKGQGYNLKYHVQQFILGNKLSGYLDNCDRYTAFFAPYINVLIYSSYLIEWLSLLYYNRECIIDIILYLF